MKKISLNKTQNLLIGRYAADENALALVIESKSGKRLCTASVYLNDIIYKKGIVALKNYSGNEDILEKCPGLEKVLGTKIGEAQTGYVTVPVYKMPDEFIPTSEELAN